MKVPAALACTGLAVAAACSAAPVPGPHRALTSPGEITSPFAVGTKPVRLSELFDSADTDSATWSADGKAIIYTSDQSGQLNIWEQPLQGGAPIQLSRSTRREDAVTTTPDGKWVIFQSDLGGRMVYGLYAMPAAGGRPVGLVLRNDATETGPVVSGDGRLMGFTLRVTKQPCSNVAVMDWATRKVRVLTHEATAGVQWEVAAIAPDGRFLIANRYDYSLTFGQVYRIDLASGAVRRITPPGVFAAASDLSPNGRYISLYMSDSHGMKQAALLDLTSGKTRFLAPSPWDQKTASFSPDGRTLLIVDDVDGREVVRSYDLATAKIARLPFPQGVNTGGFYLVTLPRYSPDGHRILFLHSSGADPQEYWVYDVASRVARPVTRLSHMSRLSVQDLPVPRLVHYRSGDGTVISAFLWMPYNLERNGRSPGVLFVHGGPTGPEMDSFQRIPAALASHGYVVLSPNYRGSTGYGEAFIASDHMDLGWGDLDDVVAGAQFLVATGYVNARKIGITGGSYGGYMTVMALARTPQVWAAGVDEFGPVNFVTMWNHTVPQDQRYLQWLIGNPVQNRQVYLRSSPLTYLGQVRAPLLVLQGLNDPLVPAEESRQLVQSLRARGREVQSHFYPQEGHGFSRRADQIDALRRLMAWFKRYLDR